MPLCYIFVPKLSIGSGKMAKMEEKTNFLEKSCRKICGFKKYSYLCNAFGNKRVFSSAGSEHLPYKQRVGGSNPSTPTQRNRQKSRFLFLFIY